jgi:hypothetical protein
MGIRKGQLTIFRCAWCDNVMVDGRVDKKCCGATCRKRWSRWKQKISRLDKQCKENLALLNDYLNHYATREQAARVVKDIELTAKRLLIEAHVQEVQ